MAATEQLSSSLAVTIVPLTRLNVPRTLPMRWRTAKPIDEWAGSTVQLPDLQLGSWIPPS